MNSVRMVEGSMESGTGDLLVRVVDSRGRDAADARAWTAFEGKPGDVVVADMEGKCSFPCLAPGNRTLWVTWGSPESAVSTEVEIQAGMVTAVTCARESGVRVEGRVRDHLRGALAGVTVVLLRKGRFTASKSATTDPDGRFRFEEVWEGTWSVSLYDPPRPGDYGGIRIPRWENWVVGKKPLIQEVVVNRPMLYGVVVDATTDLPVVGATVRLPKRRKDRDLPGLRRTVATNVYGQFAFHDLPPGRYLLVVEADGYETVAFEDVEVVEEGREWDVRLGAGSRVELRVRAPDGGLFQGRLSAFIWREEGRPEAGVHRMVEVDASGRGVVAGLPLGRYRMSLRVEGVGWAHVEAEVEPEDTHEEVRLLPFDDE